MRGRAKSHMLSVTSFLDGTSVREAAFTANCRHRVSLRRAELRERLGLLGTVGTLT